MAELALAIIPLGLAAAKGIGPLIKKLEVLYHSAGVIRRMRTDFTTQSVLFSDGCQLLLENALDPELAESLANDPDDPRWESAEVAVSVKAHLGKLFNASMATVGEIREHIHSLSKQLDVHIGSISEADRGSPSARQALRFTITKSKCDASMKGLKESNRELLALCEMANRFKRQRVNPYTTVWHALPDSYQQVARHANSFYDGMNRFWTCLQTKHTSHEIRLLIDDRRDGRLRAVVLYRTNSPIKSQCHLLDLFIRSNNLRVIPFNLSLPKTPGPVRDPKEQNPTEPKRVRFAGVVASRDEVIPTASKQESKGTEDSAPVDLCSSGDMCSQLRGHTKPDKCGGYLDIADDDLRHQLSPVCSNLCDHTECLNTKGLREPKRLDRIFEFAADHLSVPDQLGLALRLVKAVLQLHSTPWLHPLWRLDHLAFFELTGDLPKALRTLHTSSQLSCSTTREHSRVEEGAETLRDAQSLQDAQFEHGIRNLTLYSLGVALLQIEQWRLLDSGDIAHIRREADKARSSSKLGSRYHMIVEQCLNCDFGLGENDLFQPRLQDAIYTNVVCELEGLLNILQGGRPSTVLTM